MSYSSYNPPSNSDENQSQDSNTNTTNNSSNVYTNDVSSPYTGEVDDVATFKGSPGRDWIDQDLIDDIKQDLADLQENYPDAYDKLYEKFYEEFGDKYEQILNDIENGTGGLLSEIIAKIGACHGGPWQTEESVTEYDGNNVNPFRSQFPDCQTDNPDEDLEYVYDTGWNYADYSIQEPTGYHTSLVRKVRLVDLGPPRTIDNETSNTNRIQNLPPKTRRYITTEPKKFLWVHPFLERNYITVDAEGNICTDEFGEWTGDCNEGEEAAEEFRIPVSRYKTLSDWQSGPISNGPEDTDINYNCGFHSAPGGKGAVRNNVYPSGARYKTSKEDKRWIAVYGNSRGFEGGVAYTDEPTEGLQYDVVGISGWFASEYNTSAKTKSNTGIKFAYNMYRIDTTVDELKYNINMYQEILDEFNQNLPGGGVGGVSVSDGSSETTSYSRSAPSLLTLGEPTEDGWSKEDIKILSANNKQIIENAKKLSDYIDFNYKNLYQKGAFEKWKSTRLKKDDNYQSALDHIFDIMNYELNKSMGRSPEKHEILINSEEIQRKISSDIKVTYKDLVNNILTQFQIKRPKFLRRLRDFDFEAIARYELKIDEDDREFRRAQYFTALVNNYDVEKLVFRDGKLAAQLTSGMIITQDRYERGLEGFCDACDEVGGQTSMMGRQPIMECQKIVFDRDLPDSDYEWQTLATYRLEEEEYPGDVLSVYKTPYEGQQQYNPNARLVAGPHGSTSKVDVVRPDGSSYKAGQWRGQYAVPTTGPAAPGNWNYYETEIDPRTMHPLEAHTYGPFDYEEMNTYYNWIVPTDGVDKTPQEDYGVTWWFSDSPDGPFNNATITKVAEPVNSPTSKGWNLGKPRGRYFRLTFWQWRAKVGNSKGPKVRKEQLPPGYKIGGVDQGGTMEGGLFFDTVVTPKMDNPLEIYDDEDSGPCYMAPNEQMDLPMLHDDHWGLPITTLSQSGAIKEGYYKIWSKEPNEQANDNFKARNEPRSQRVFSARTANPGAGFLPEDDPFNFEEQLVEDPVLPGETYYTYQDNWFPGTVVPRGGKTNYRIVYMPKNGNLIFSSYDPTRPENNLIGDEIDWAKFGEPWINFERISKEKITRGPAYWGELMQNRPRPNFYSDKWQNPLNIWSTFDYQDEWEMDPDNVDFITSNRYEIKAHPGENLEGRPKKTPYDYDIYFVTDTDWLDKYYSKNDLARYNKPPFVYAGTLKKDDYVGFVITAPTPYAIFHARNTNRLITSWFNDGEQVQIRTRYNENPDTDIVNVDGVPTELSRDFRKGPAYWAFGDYGLTDNNRKGFRGRPDFNSAYWMNPLTDWNSMPENTNVKVKKGKVYRITPGPTCRYTYRPIWGIGDDASVNPIFNENPNLLPTEISDKPNTKNYYFEDDSKLIRPPHAGADVSIPVEVEAQSDLLYFGAFRYDATDDGAAAGGVDRPTYNVWSVQGENLDVFIEEVDKVEGCSFWASEGAFNANTFADLNKYKKPLIHLTQECKDIVQKDRDNDPNSPSINDLEQQSFEREMDGGEKKKYNRVFDITPGKPYAISITDRTPGYEYRIRFLKDREDLTNNNYVDVTPNELKDNVWNPSLPDSETLYIDNAPSEYIVIDVFYAGKAQDRWSKRGEPVYMTLWESDKDKTIQGKQYWIDWQNPQDPTAFTVRTTEQLNDGHWKNPLWKIPDNTFEPGKTYEIWAPEGATVNKGNPNPEYMHVLIVGTNPQSITVGAPKDFVIMGAVGNQRLKYFERPIDPNRTTWNGEGNKFRFKAPKDKTAFLIGAWETGTRRQQGLQGWNNEGEDILLKYREVDVNYKGPVYWADHSADLDQNDYGYVSATNYNSVDHWSFPDIGREEDPSHPTGNPYYTQAYFYGENKNEVQLTPGRKYRLITWENSTGNKPDLEPQEQIDHLPYNVRQWWVSAANVLNALDPAKSKYDQFIPGREVSKWAPYFDFEAKTPYLVFGATGTEKRGMSDWSTNGEPLNYKIDALSNVPSGPSYSMQSLNTLPDIENPHFNKPITVERVTPGTMYEWKPGQTFGNEQGIVQLWFIKNEGPNDALEVARILNQYTNNNFATASATRIHHVDPLHPEDFLIKGPNGPMDWFIPAEIIDLYYVKGPIIDTQNSQPFKYKVPAGCNRFIYGWVDRYGQSNAPGTRAFGANISPRWGANGMAVDIQFDPAPRNPLEGPVYWGDNANGTPEFSNSYFTSPLNYHNKDTNNNDIKGGNTYVFRTKVPVADAFKEYKRVDIYEFDPRKTDILDPNLNRIGDFTKIGSITENDPNGEIIIDPRKSGIILSARGIKPTANKSTINDWSENGEPSPFELVKTDKIAGPSYIAGIYAWDTTPIDPTLPDLPNEHWRALNILPVGQNPYAEYELVLTKDLDDYDLTPYVSQKVSMQLGVGSAARKSDWKGLPVGNPGGTSFKRGAKKGDTIRIPIDMEPKSIMFGVTNFRAGLNRTLENWSAYGEPVDVEVRQVDWGRGPGFPAERKNTNNNYIIDWKNDRWNQPMEFPLKPLGKGKFTPGVNYEFKRKNATLEQKKWLYQLIWATDEFTNHSKTQVKYDKKNLSPTASIDKVFTKLCPAPYNFVYFSIYKQGVGNETNTGPLTDWSPNGTPVPWKAKKDRRTLDDLWNGPIWNIIMAILQALVASLLGTLFYFMYIAPYETLVEMNEEHSFNEYPIRRKKTIYYDDPLTGKEKEGYLYPKEEYIKNDEDFYTGLKNDPIYFNYTADASVRAYIRIMKFRHNGYMFHLTNAKAQNTGGNWQNNHRLNFYNLSPTYGYNLQSLYNDTFKRALRFYDLFPDENGNWDRLPERYNPISNTGAKVFQVCCELDKNKQYNEHWDDRLVWFSPTLSYSPLVVTDTVWKSKAGAQYKICMNYNSSGAHLSYPSIDGTYNVLPNIFNELGAGLTINRSFNTDNSAHSFALEIINGDTNHVWPGTDPSRGKYFPGIEFDIKWDGNEASRTDEWQIVEMHLNYAYKDPFIPEDEPDQFIAYAVRKLRITEGNYVMRNTYDNSDSKNTFNQVNSSKPKVHVKMMATEAIEYNAVLYSITASVWVGSNGTSEKRNFIISNLKPLVSY